MMCLIWKRIMLQSKRLNTKMTLILNMESKMNNCESTPNQRYFDMIS